MKKVFYFIWALSGGMISFAAMADDGAPVSRLGPYGLMAVKVGVSDVEKAVAFYTTVLGMRRGAKFNESEQGLEWPNPGQGSNIILVHGAADRIQHDYGWTLTPGAAYLMMHVPNVDESAARLRAGGSTIIKGPEYIKQYDVRLLFVRDPDGNLLELLQ